MPLAKKRVPTKKQLDALARGREKMCKKYTAPLEARIVSLERMLAIKQRQLQAFFDYDM